MDTKKLINQCVEESLDRYISKDAAIPDSILEKYNLLDTSQSLLNSNSININSFKEIGWTDPFP